MAETEALVSGPGAESEKSNMNALMDSIERNDLESCKTILSRTKFKFLNKRAEILAKDSNIYTLTPLLVAVYKKRYDIVKLFLSMKKCNRDKFGYFKSKTSDTLVTVCPLFLAMWARDPEMVKLLLEGGANVQLNTPAPQYTEEEGAHVSYLGPQSLLNFSVNFGPLIMKMMVEKADFSEEYGSRKKTFLCEAACSMGEVQGADLDVIVLTAQRGGRFCWIKCEHLYDCLQKCVNIDKSKCEVSCKSISNMNMMRLLSQLEYKYEGSKFYHDTKLFGERNSTNACSCYKYCCNRSKDFFNWVSNFENSPSSLKDICRYVIRQHIRNISPEKCDTLPLPVTLRDYLNLKKIDCFLLAKDETCTSSQFEKLVETEGIFAALSLMTQNEQFM